jgi:N-acetylgalactosamine-N,N'-diacetylbacillosaminyl-diphospho-undecaprenol 4-alpha-N-acetylgalactosaminyltransferase
VTPSILLINSLGTGGAERAVRAAAARLQATGRDIRIVCLEHHSVQITLPPGVPVIYLSRLSASSSPVLKLVALPFLALRLSTCISRFGSRTVMSHLFRANFVNVLARVLAGSRHKAVVVNHTRVGRLRDEGLHGRINWVLCRLLYPKADFVASVSTGCSMECARLLRLPQEKAIILYDPIEMSAFAAAGAKRTTRNPETLEGPVRTIIAIGRLVALKRFQDLIDAFSEVANKAPQLQLKIVGNGPERSRLERRSVQSGWADRIHFLGQLAEPAKELAGTDVFVSTSAVEGFGMAIVEALAAGIPVISADCAFGPREILSPSTNSTQLLKNDADIERAEYGILYPVGSVKALQKALQCILNEGTLRKEMSQKGPIRAAEFSVERSTAAYEKLLFA